MVVAGSKLFILQLFKIWRVQEYTGMLLHSCKVRLPLHVNVIQTKQLLSVYLFIFYMYHFLPFSVKLFNYRV